MNTPLPNKIKASSDIQLRHYIAADDGMYFAEIVYGTGEGSFECAKQRAENIIHRWNCHDQLIQALKAARNGFYKAELNNVPQHSNSLSMIDAALALASGTQEEMK